MRWCKTAALVALIGFWFVGCGRNQATTKQEIDPTFGQSFFVITGMTTAWGRTSYDFVGYDGTKVPPQATIEMPGAVLVVGDKKGANLGGARFEYGSIILVEGTPAVPTFRLATPQDKIVLRSELTILGKMYGKGPFPVPPGGKLTGKKSAAESSLEENK